MACFRCTFTSEVEVRVAPAPNAALRPSDRRWVCYGGNGLSQCESKATLEKFKERDLLSPSMVAIEGSLVAAEARPCASMELDELPRLLAARWYG